MAAINPLFKVRREGETPTSYEVAVALAALAKKRTVSPERGEAGAVYAVLNDRLSKRVNAVHMLTRRLHECGITLTVTDPVAFNKWSEAWEHAELVKRIS